MKEFLSQNGIDYMEYDVEKEPAREAELKERTGTRIVPGIIIHKRVLGLIPQQKTFIGFLQNKDEIEKLLL